MSGISLWQVLILLTPIALVAVVAAAFSKRKSPSQADAEQQPDSVRIVDIEMPFGSMVTFMVKWALASIPALIILSLFGFVVAMMIGVAGR